MGKNLREIFALSVGRRHMICKRDNGGDGTETKESGSKILREAYHESKMARLKWMFIGMFLVAIIAFPMGHILSGIAFAIAGILAMPWLIKKAGSKKVLLIIGSTILVLIGIFTWYWDDALRKEGCIEYIKTYPMATADYTIEDFLDLLIVRMIWIGRMRKLMIKNM